MYLYEMCEVIVFVEVKFDILNIEESFVKMMLNFGFSLN